MKVLIWIGFLFLFSMGQSAINMSGVTLGAIATIIYWAFFYWCARTCCGAWDKHKNGNNQTEETIAIPEAEEVSLSDSAVKSEKTTEFVLCPKCGKSQKSTRRNCYFCGTDLAAEAEIKTETEMPVLASERDYTGEILVPDEQGTLNSSDAAVKSTHILSEPSALVQSDVLANQQAHYAESEPIQENIQECDDYIYAAYCGKCGGKIVDGNKFCIYCGAEVPKVPKPGR